MNNQAEKRLFPAIFSQHHRTKADWPIQTDRIAAIDAANTLIKRSFLVIFPTPFCTAAYYRKSFVRSQKPKEHQLRTSFRLQNWRF